jgi:hypothetical protein
MVEMSNWASGRKTTWPRELPASAKPSIRPRLRGNQGERTAAVVKEEMEFSPTVAKML